MGQLSSEDEVGVVGEVTLDVRTEVEFVVCAGVTIDPLQPATEKMIRMAQKNRQMNLQHLIKNHTSIGAFLTSPITFIAKSSPVPSQGMPHHTPSCRPS